MKIERTAVCGGIPFGRLSSGSAFHTGSGSESLLLKTQQTFGNNAVSLASGSCSLFYNDMIVYPVNAKVVVE